MTDASRLFTKTALDRLASPEQMDQLLSFGSVRLWLALLALLGVLAVATAWGFMGSISSEVSGQGVLLRAGGVESVPSLGEGQIATVLVVPGQHVQQGTIVATLDQPQQTDELSSAEAALAGLEHQQEQMQSTRGLQEGLQNTSFKKQIAVLRQEAADLRQRADQLRQQQVREHDLLGKGLITREQSIATDHSLRDLETAIEQNAEQLTALQSEQYQQTHAGDAEALQLDNQIVEARKHVDELQHSMENLTEVRSASSGEVLEVEVRPGAVVHQGTPILLLQRGSKGLHAVVYAPAEKSKQIHPGMTVQISPAGLKREEYGFLRGAVVSVSPFPVSAEQLMDTLSNSTLVDSMEAKGPVSAVEVALEPNTAVPGSFRWSSPKGDAVPLSAGTLLTADIVVHEQKPVTLVIPYAREKIGWR
ncbi:MAG: NHLP bacteriocin system secretion protein [Terriglobia bacterium]